ncbi:ABC transporter substrate-binding protein [Halalkalibacter okhensis]|uniref:Binding protein msmE n=1 Tax=Halalkalibacter okhensis TaxID=333138 RepID=A0A0B0IN51_9BACI|nr:ABC transporter substrate-binding protein [Halalkalibacter okhensis]KHF41484.1 binding protein msmE [Halalkalibacter okhensis]
MKKAFRTFTGILMGAMVLTACGGESTGSSISSNALSLYSGVSDDAEKEAIEEVALAFTEETGISVDVNFPGTGYEDQLRVRMASNDLPDLFDTHGWAINRYGEYTADLSEMEWVEHFDEAMAPILRDEEGKVYAFPINQAKDGIMYNATLLNEYGIEPPTTFDEWSDAMEAVKEESNGEVTPLWIPGSNQYTIAQVLDQLSTPLLVTDENNNFEEDLLDGSFDWSNYTPLAEFLKGLQEQGLLNTDVLTASEAQRIELMAQNKIAFAFAGGAFGPAVTELNPEIQVGTIPVPAYWEGDDPSWIGGERNTFAVFKDSEKLDEAKQFIEFLAQPDNAKKLAEASSLPAGITNVETENYYTEFYDEWAHVQIQPYFDRVYLPSGMWDVYATTGQELLADTLTVEQVSAEMESEYLRLRNQ